MAAGTASGRIASASRPSVAAIESLPSPRPPRWSSHRAPSSRHSPILSYVFAALWVAFGAALIWSQGSLDQAWATIRGLPLIVQLGVWLLFPPVMAGLWVWETAWPLVVRVLMIAGLAGWNLLVFMPKALQTVRP